MSSCGIKRIGGALAVIAASVTATQALAVVPASAAVQRAERHGADAAFSGRAAFAERAAAYVQGLEGIPYVFGGTSTSGFDCSGLARYVYSELGLGIARTAQAQFQQFRPESRDQAQNGDLVFFHNTADPASPVYHVGIYEGGDSMVAASSAAGHVVRESFSWAGDTVTFGTITH